MLDNYTNFKYATAMKIKKKELIKYLKNIAQELNEHAADYAKDRDYGEADACATVSSFLMDDLINGIKYDFSKEAK